MRKTIVFFFACLLQAGACFGFAEYDYNLTRTVTSGAMTVIDLSSLGQSAAVVIANDSLSSEVYVNWDGRITQEAEMSTDGWRLLPGEVQSRDMQTKKIRLKAQTGSVSTRIGVVF
ncbi:MAG: hypothetical protein WC529_08895 [Candidatus Margulisiibacteriota bacterium]